MLLHSVHIPGEAHKLLSHSRVGEKRITNLIVSEAPNWLYWIVIRTSHLPQTLLEWEPCALGSTFSVNRNALITRVSTPGKLHEMIISNLTSMPFVSREQMPWNSDCCLWLSRPEGVIASLFSRISGYLEFRVVACDYLGLCHCIALLPNFLDEVEAVKAAAMERATSGFIT